MIDAASSATTVSDDDRIIADPDAMAAGIQSMRRDDAAAVTVLTERGRSWLRDAAKTLAYKRSRPVVGHGEKAVTQDFDISTNPPWDSAWGECARLMSNLVNAGLANMRQPPCPPVRFNEAVIQYYRPCACGISPHRDHVRYINVIGILIVDGEGDFYVCADRAGNGARRIPAGPGDFLLMRGPDFDESRYRPFHMLGAVRTDRLIVGYRQDTRPGEAD
jgi:hypothetical protein